MVSQTTSSQVLTICKGGDSVTILENLWHCLTILTIKKKLKLKTPTYPVFQLVPAAFCSITKKSLIPSSSLSSHSHITYLDTHNPAHTPTPPHSFSRLNNPSFQPLILCLMLQASYLWSFTGPIPTCPCLPYHRVQD